MFILAECNIPPIITGILSQLYKIIIILVPLGIVIFGSIDFIKATIAKDSNAIASSVKTFINRLITGCITFFVLAIVTWLFKSLLSGVGEANSAMDCALKIIGGTAGSSSGNNSVSQVANKMVCYGTQYSACISQNQSPNKVEECTKSANTMCGTNNKPAKTTTTTTTTTTKNYNKTDFKTCEECQQYFKKEIAECTGNENDNIYTSYYNDCNSHYISNGYSIGNFDSNYFVDAAALYADCAANNGNDANSSNCQMELANYKAIIQKYNLGSGTLNIPSDAYTEADLESGFRKGITSEQYTNKCISYAQAAQKEYNDGQFKEKYNSCSKMICKQICK